MLIWSSSVYVFLYTTKGGKIMVGEGERGGGGGGGGGVGILNPGIHYKWGRGILNPGIH